MRITLTEAKAALAGVIAITSFAIFIASIAAFNEERVTSRLFGRWGFGSMVETRGSCEQRAWRAGCAKEPKIGNRSVDP